MGQRNDLALKRKVQIDGTEWQGLVSVSELNFERNVIEVPEFSWIRNIQSGITKVPQVDLVYKVDKGSSTMAALRSWFFNNEVHQVVVQDTDAYGTVFEQYILQDCEASKLSDPEYDAATPGYAKFTIHICPYAVTMVDPATVNG